MSPRSKQKTHISEIVTSDHIIPRSVCEELDNCLFTLEMMPLTLNQGKSAKVGQRQIDLTRRWHKQGLLSKAGLDAVLTEWTKAKANDARKW